MISIEELQTAIYDGFFYSKFKNLRFHSCFTSASTI